MTEAANNQGTDDSHPDRSTVNTGGGAYVQGGVHINGGDFVGRDKNVINNIVNLIQQASSAVEELEKQNQVETRRLAEGVIAFAERLKKSASNEGDASTVYKGLLEYGLADADRFFGRNDAGLEFMDKMKTGRLTVIQAESGSGKSSFLQAKISPILIAAGRLPIYLRSYTDAPHLDIKRAILPHLDQNETLKSASLRDFLLTVSSVLPHSRLYIILDQFEEFFTQFDEKVRASFVDQLEQCLADTSLDVHWVLSLRTEFFGRLAGYEPPLSPFDNQYLLSALKREEAKEAIVNPAAASGVIFETGLVDTILDELTRNERGGDLVAPPQLQLVCSALFERLDGASEVTRERYESLGGVTGILSSYLENVMRKLPEDERVVVRTLLEALIDSNKQRAHRTREELANDPGLRAVQSETIDKALGRLAARRLLRIQERHADGVITYELAHDYLVKDIAIEERILARKRVQELLDQSLREFQQHKILLRVEELAIINPYRQELSLTSEAEKLIAVSERKLKLRRRFAISFGGVVAILTVATAVLMIFALRARQTIRNADESMRLLFENNGLIPIGLNPKGLAFDGERVWVANTDSPSVQAINPNTGKIENVVTLKHVSSVLYFDGKRLWVSSSVDRSLQAIDPETGKLGRKVKLTASPQALLSDGQKLWILYFDMAETERSGAIQAVNPETGAIEPPIKVVNSAEAIAFDGKRIWIASKNNSTVQSVDRTSRQASDPINVGMQPDLMVYIKERLWLGSRDFGTFRVVNPETREITTPKPDGDSLTVSNYLFEMISDGSQLWLSSGDKSVFAIDPENYTVSEKIQVGASPYAIVFDGMRLWIANNSDMTVQAVEPAAAFLDPHPVKFQSLGDVRTIAVNENFLYVAQDSALSQLDLRSQNYVLNEPFIRDFCAYELKFVANKLWFINCNRSLQALDLETRQISEPIALGQQPEHLIFDGKHLWLSNVSSDTVQAIDVSTRLVSHQIHVGKFPMSLAFDGKRIWVVTQETLQAIDPVQGSVISTINYFGGSGPSLGMYALPSDMLFVAGKLWIVSDETELRVIDPETQKVTTQIRVGEGRKSLVFDEKRIWIANHRKSTLRAIDPNSLSLGAPFPIGPNHRSITFDGKRLWIAYWNNDTLHEVTVHR